MLCARAISDICVMARHIYIYMMYKLNLNSAPMCICRAKWRLVFSRTHTACVAYRAHIRAVFVFVLTSSSFRHPTIYAYSHRTYSIVYRPGRMSACYGLYAKTHVPSVAKYIYIRVGVCIVYALQVNHARSEVRCMQILVYVSCYWLFVMCAAPRGRHAAEHTM